MGRRTRIGLLLFLAVPVRAESYGQGSLSSGGRDRTYHYHVPSSHDGESSLPVLILLHGGTGNGRQALRDYPLRQVADREGFLLVAPDGTGPFEKPVLLTWNVHFGFGAALRKGVDDTAFLGDLITHLAGRFRIDPDRVYLSGLSNGAILCHFAGAALSGRIAGIAPVVGGLGGRDEAQARKLRPVRPRRPVPVIMFYGAQDRNIPLHGGWQQRAIGRKKFYLSAMETAQWWVGANGCDPQPVMETGPGYRRYTWTGDREGARVVLYVVLDNGHAWPGGAKPRSFADEPSTQVKAHEVMWKFFEENPPEPINRQKGP